MPNGSTIVDHLIGRGEDLGDAPGQISYVVWKSEVYNYTIANYRIPSQQLKDIDDAFWRGESTPPSPNRALGRTEVCNELGKWQVTT